MHDKPPNPYLQALRTYVSRAMTSRVATVFLIVGIFQICTAAHACTPQAAHEPGGYHT